MTATSFDVPMFHRRSDVVTTLLASLEQREAAIAEREAAIARRERAVEYEERFHELRGFSAGGSEAAAGAARRIEPAESVASPLREMNSLSCPSGPSAVNRLVMNLGVFRGFSMYNRTGYSRR